MDSEKPKPANSRTLAVCILAASSLTFASATDAPTSAVGTWRYSETVDSMTDEILREAVCENSGGFTFRIMRRVDGRVWALFRLPASSLDTLATDSPIAYRVDKHPAREVQKTSALIEREIGPTVVAEPKWVHFLLWHGEGPSPSHGEFRELLDGETLLVRYFLFTGGYKETSFTLVGAREVIATAADIAPTADPLAVQRDTATVIAVKQCTAVYNPLSDDTLACIAKIRACGSQWSLSAAAEFDACVVNALAPSPDQRVPQR